MTKQIQTNAILSDEDMEYLDQILLEYGNDDSILGISELDGFLTALVSGPRVVVPSVWLPALWGDQEPEWPSQAEYERFLQTVFSLMNNNALVLMHEPEQFAPIFEVNSLVEEEILIVESWCFGYMRGVALGQWPALPADMQHHLNAIALHGLEENFEKLDALSLEEHQATVPAIEEAARQLHAYWLAQRETKHQPVRAAPGVGRNAPCPCGSGKKFKHCCLH